MHWMRTHPVSLLFAAAGLALLAIVLTTQAHTGSAPAGPIVSLSTGAIEPLPTPGNPSEIQSGALPPPLVGLASGASFPQTSAQPGYEQPAPSAKSGPTSARLASSPEAAATPSTLLSISQIYALFPSGGASALGAGTSAARTPEQQALYDYGNAAGQIVLDFENAHAGMASVLQAWLKARTDAAAVEEVKAIGRDMTAAGEALETLADVPPAAKAANANLAASFKAAADELTAVADAGGSNSALIDAIKAYDAAADAFTRSYIALADVFTFNNVTFASGDPGSAFTFSGNGGL